MDDDLLIVERHGRVVLLTLNNAARLNSLVKPLRDLLAATVPALIADPDVRAIVLTGAGRGFCSGGDFSQKRDRAQPVGVHRDMQGAQQWLRLLVESDTPLVTAVNGPAAGAGFGLALLGDVVLASDQAFFKAGFPRIGVPADYLLGWTLPRAVGSVRAFDILTSDRRVAAKEAAALGMVTRVVSQDALIPQALETAHALAEGPYSIGLMKKLLRDSPGQSLDSYLQQEAFAFAMATGSDDYQAGIDAFREKRAPSFHGR